MEKNIMDTEQQTTKPISILFSYTREDEVLRDKIENHLSTLKRKERIVCWHDRHIHAGNTWSLEISSHLDTSDIILLLISADFLASDYCNQVEVKRAMERHTKGEVCVIPVILRQVDWHDEDFAAFQALPQDAKPVTEWTDEDAALSSIAKGIKKAVQDLETARRQS